MGYVEIIVELQYLYLACRLQLCTVTDAHMFANAGVCMYLYLGILVDNFQVWSIDVEGSLTPSDTQICWLPTWWTYETRTMK